MSKGLEMNMVAVAIDRDKGSQIALKWAVDNLLPKTRAKSVNASLPAAITLLHVKHKSSSYSSGSNDSATAAANGQAKDVFLPFRCFCTRKDIKVHEIVLEDTDVARALCNYVKSNKIENLVIGSSVKNGFIRKLKNVDISGNVLKGAPDFCNVYVISKGKVASERLASATSSERSVHGQGQIGAFMSPFGAKANTLENLDSIKSPFSNTNSIRSYGEFSLADSDISFVSSGRPSSDRLSAALEQDLMMFPRLSYSSDTDNRLSIGSETNNRLSIGSETNNCFALYSGSSQGSMNYSWSSGTQTMDDIESEMRRLKQELKQTMDMYSSACKEALTAKHKAMELQRWKVEELQKIEEARLSEGAALAIAEQEKEKCRAAIQKAEAAQRLAEQEAQRRKDAEMKALKAADEKKKVLEKLAQNDTRYRKYTIEEIEAATDHFSASRKIGEGGYGPVYKCSLDHTPVAVKVLRPDATQGRSQFQQEVEVLSCMRHPNMVLLLGACPEYGCLVYEYMANGSLEDRLLRRGNSPVLSWQLRFRIAAEIATALLFLHQTKPEPLVHRDLKPGNILLDNNFVSKISDVGLARLVPASVADNVTQYRMTSAAGTFCYIDPEYQQTGMLGTKSDIYSLGVMLLQIITAKPPMGLTHHVERAIENRTFTSMLDPEVKDWPLEETLSFAKMSLRCVELRRKDRPDLGTVVLPELNRLRELGEKTMPSFN